MRINGKGFTLIELLVVIVIVAVISVMVMILINPLELIKRGRDSNRITDLVGIQQAINLVLQDNNNDTSVLCDNILAPCQGRSDESLQTERNVDGTGWVKVDLSGEKSLSFAVLPVDPTNDATYHYSYFSDGHFFELNALLESERYRLQQVKDGGNNSNLLEIGTKLNLLN